MIYTHLILGEAKYIFQPFALPIWTCEYSYFLKHVCTSSMLYIEITNVFSNLEERRPFTKDEECCTMTVKQVHAMSNAVLFEKIEIQLTCRV